MPRVISSTELRNGYNDISTWCHHTNEPAFVTKNGAGDYTFEIDSTDDNGNRIVGTFQGTILDYQDQSCE
jgi:hypothetical protein